MKKRIIASLLIVIMALSALGCAPAKTGEIPEGTRVSLTVWNEPQEDKEKNWYYQAEQATGIGVDVTVIPESEYSAKLNQIVATKSDADIMIIWECDIKNFVDAGGILNLDDYIAKSSINKGDFIDAVSKLSDGLGGTYGVPWCAATEVMYYNKDMFDAAGIAYPTNDWTYAEYLAAAKALTQYNADGTTAVYGATLPNRQTWWAGVGGAGDKVYDLATGQLVIGDGAKAFVQDCQHG
jgi:multiple sugar transport system substrate-binding protein